MSIFARIGAGVSVASIVYHFVQTHELARQLGEAPFGLGTVARVVAAWARESDSGAWEGGFLLRLRDGAYVYLTGWCGDEGWGVQDGASAIMYGEEPQWRDSGFFKVPKHLAKRMGVPEWNEDTAELNRYVVSQGTRLE